MAPFRNRDRSNRSGRGQVEHILEGLPISQWREAEVPIEPSPSDNAQIDKDAWPELPMPRDSHLLPLHSQQLLRAARAGRIYKPPAPPEDDREIMDDEDEPKEIQHGFTIKKFVKVPRQLEEPEPEYLAKRRKGLPSLHAVNGLAAQPTPLRETKVKKVDSEGNVSVYKALVPEGQTIEGEVEPTDVSLAEAAPAAAAPGTIVEGVGIVNAEGVVVVGDIAQQTPPRRRPHPPKKIGKKKSKGGPGRPKKKVGFVEGSTEQGTPASGSDLLAVPGLKQESGSVEPSDGDTPMADAGDEDDGEEESDEEGEDRGHSPMPAASATSPKAVEFVAVEPVTNAVQETTKGFPPPPAAASIGGASVPTQSILPPREAGPSVDLKVKTEKSEGPSRGPSSSPELPLSAIAHSRQNSLNHVPTGAPLGPSVPAIPSPTVAETPADPLSGPAITNGSPHEVPSVVHESVPQPAETDAPALGTLPSDPSPLDSIPSNPVPSVPLASDPLPPVPLPSDSLSSVPLPSDSLSSVPLPSGPLPSGELPLDELPPHPQDQLPSQPQDQSLSQPQDQVPPQPQDQLAPQDQVSSQDQLPPQPHPLQPQDQVAILSNNQLPPQSTDQPIPQPTDPLVKLEDQLPPQPQDQLPPQSPDQLPPQTQGQLPLQPQDQSPPQPQDQVPPQHHDPSPPNPVEQLPPQPLDANNISDGEPDLLESLEAHLDKNSREMAGS